MAKRPPVPKESPACAICGRSGATLCDLAVPDLPAGPARSSRTRFRAGQVVFGEGDDAEAMYCVESGGVKLYKVGAGGEVQIIRLIGPGEAFGYRPLLSGEPYAVTAETIEPSTICRVPRQTVFDLVRSSQDFALRLLAKLSRELRVSEELALSLKYEPVLQRTARLLLSFVPSSGPQASAEVPIRLPLLRLEMAQMIASTPESLSRALHELSRRGMVRLARTVIVVQDLEALRDLAVSRRSASRLDPHQEPS